MTPVRTRSGLTEAEWRAKRKWAEKQYRANRLAAQLRDLQDRSAADYGTSGLRRRAALAKAWQTRRAEAASRTVGAA